MTAVCDFHTRYVATREGIIGIAVMCFIVGGFVGAFFGVLRSRQHEG